MNNIKGYGFRPSDVELIGYLQAMTHDRDSLVQYITQLKDICEYEPRELPGLSSMEPGCRQWYFFYSLNYKYQNGKLIKRTTKEGYWKPTGRSRKIKASETNTVIGSKRSLTFQKGHPKAKNKKKKNSKTKSDDDKNKTKHENTRNKTKSERNKRNKAVWVLHEYQLNTATPSNYQNTFFLGKLMKQSEEANISNNNGESNHSSPTNLKNGVAKNITIPEDHLNPSKPFPEVEVCKDSDGVQNQFSTKKQDNDVQNDESCPQEGSNQHNFLDKNEVSNLTCDLGDYAPVDPISRDWGDSNWWPVTEFEVPKDSALVQNQFSCDHGNPTENSVVVNNSKTYSEERSNQNNIVAENEGSNLVANFKNDHTEDFDPIDLFDYEFSHVDEVLAMIQTPENYNVLQNQSSINEEDINTKYSNFVDNETHSPEKPNYPVRLSTPTCLPWAQTID